MRYFFDNYLAYITVCFPKVKGFESAYEALSKLLKENGSAAITSDNCKNLLLKLGTWLKQFEQARCLLEDQL